MERERMSVDTVEADGIIVATLDDGKVNALTVELIHGMRSAIATASERGQPLVVSGRDGCFSAGFDLAVMKSGDEDLVSALLSDGARLYRELVEAPVPVVASCTGHALAGGALLLLGADYRIGRTGPYQVGLNEIRIGMALPAFAVALATYRLERRFLTAATMFAEVGSPERAVSIGFLDEIVDDPLSRACSFAASLAALPPKPLAVTKHRVRQGLQQELTALERQDRPSGTPPP
jgi:enoyl-CoA hydratase